MEYSKELTAIQMWLKSTAGLNSFKRGTNVNLSRPVVLFDVPERYSDLPDHLQALPGTSQLRPVCPHTMYTATLPSVRKNTW